MTKKIQILPQHLYNKIAAGEVVGRPESVVKELIENSIDAGATEITLLIKDAGKALIQVIDNGSGIEEEDAVLAFQRHSTSKIATYEDLENIATLGFRGEALASIAAIAQVEMKTRTAKSDVAVCIKIEGNEVIETSKIQFEQGTSIAVKNLFYNTPGRRNFLKSNQTEFRHIYETFVRLTISNPSIAFKFFNNEELIFNLKPSSLQLRIGDLMGEDFSKALLPVKNDHPLIKLNGFISKPGFTKKSKQDQYFYLNKRFFQNKNLNFAVYSGYEHLIEKGDYPSFFLFLELDPKKVDVNVHPSKMEVKFEDEGVIFGFIRKTIKESLVSNDLTFDIGFSVETKTDNSSSDLRHIEPRESSPAKFGSGYSFNLRSPDTNASIHSIFQASRNEIPEKETEDVFKIPEPDKLTFEHSKKEKKFNLWQYQNKYIMCETETGLMIIDQHAAHERVLYEKSTELLNSQSSFSQHLLIPIKIQLTKIDYQLAKSLSDEIQNLGFVLKFSASDIIEVTGIPSDVRPGDEKNIVQALIDQYKEYEIKLNLDKRDNLAKSFACRGAVKSGDFLYKEEMENLIDALFACKMPYVCPHGRPTVIRITTEELDKRFSRT